MVIKVQIQEVAEASVVAEAVEATAVAEEAVEAMEAAEVEVEVEVMLLLDPRETKTHLSS